MDALPWAVEPAPRAGNDQRAVHVVDDDPKVTIGLPTRISWLAFTVEAIVLPFDGESTPELELESAWSFSLVLVVPVAPL
jgi:hypothetical protein